MEKFLALFRLGIKYLHRHRRRYYFLLAALIFGFAIVTFATSIKDGMYDSAYYAAQSHYAGDIVAVGYDYIDENGFIHRLGHEEIAAIMLASEVSAIKIEHTLQRTLYGETPFVYHNGIAVQLRYLTGSDWEKEEHIFNKMNFLELPDDFLGDDGIILSAPVAQHLGARKGDMVIVELDNRYRQKNTGSFIVRGIVEDNSIFGFFKAYISRLALNRLLLYDDDDCSTVGFFLENPATAEQDRALLQELLSAQIQTGPLVYNREGMNRERSGYWEGINLFLYTLPVYLSEIAALLNVLNIVTYFIYAMMLIIILASAGVTYRLILHERSREIGIMRALGFYGRDLRFVLWSEMSILGLIAVLFGFLFAHLLGWAASFISFSWFPGFDIFLKDGKLSALYVPQAMFVNAIALLLVLIILSLLPSFRVSKKSLPELFRGEL